MALKISFFLSQKIFEIVKNIFFIKWGLEIPTCSNSELSIVNQFSNGSDFEWSAIFGSLFEWSRPIQNQTFKTAALA